MCSHVHYVAVIFVFDVILIKSYIGQAPHVFPCALCSCYFLFDFLLIQSYIGQATNVFPYTLCSCYFCI